MASRAVLPPGLEAAGDAAVAAALTALQGVELQPEAKVCLNINLSKLIPIFLQLLIIYFPLQNTVVAQFVVHLRSTMPAPGPGQASAAVQVRTY